MIPIFFNDLSKNLILYLFYEILGCILDLVKTAQLIEQSEALADGCLLCSK